MTNLTSDHQMIAVKIQTEINAGIRNAKIYHRASYFVGLNYYSKSEVMMADE